MRDVRGVLITNDPNITVELGRIQYNGNTAKVYLPKKVRDALKLDPQKDNAMILLYDHKNGTVQMILNQTLRNSLRPQILASRKLYSRIKRKID